MHKRLNTSPTDTQIRAWLKRQPYWVRVDTTREQLAALAFAAGHVAALAERRRLRGLLAEAVSDIEDWAGYASEYFQEKHDLKGTLAKYHVALARSKP